MSQTVSISKARARLPALSKQMSKAGRPEALAITQRGKLVLALLNWEFYESLIETLEIMGDQELMAALRQGSQEAKQGKRIPWKAAKKKLGLYNLARKLVRLGLA